MILTPTLAVVCAAAPTVLAAPVRVTVMGTVEYNSFNSGTFAQSVAPAGSPVVMTIELDSTDYLDSPNLPGITRGFRFGPEDFSLRIADAQTTLAAGGPQAYFVLRNDDPRVDGVFISQGTDIDTQVPLAITPVGFGIAFQRTFDGAPPPPSTDPDPTFTSLELTEAVGSWGLENLSAYHMAVQQNEVVVPMGIGYETLTIELLCAADVGGTGGVAGADGSLDNNDFVVFIDWFFAADVRADRGSTGGVAGSDGAFDNNDFVVFIDQFFAGCG
ncbi:MAG TPA: GC-type dockerin domain-anchored protein [Phycisphaerales bacterium]|nr:GC-type dockerin domain-anchored protein [Phycisphaerales bacterium]